MAQAKEVVIEVRRHGRRPRYHRGTQVHRGLVRASEQCNTDQAGLERLVLDKLPAMPRPWTQLCRRCWRGSAAWREALFAQAQKEGQLATD